MARKENKEKLRAADIPGRADRRSLGLPADRRLIIVAGAIAAVCLAIYFRTLFADFINLDDDLYVYDNPFVLGGLGIKGISWALTAFQASNWHPLTWISHQLDVSLFGASAGGHHATSVLLHTINSLLLFSLMRWLTGAFWKSALVAAIFAVHPAHVESVAWVAERKDVLSTFFWLLTTIAYVRWAGNTANKKLYIAAVILFAAGLAAKPMLVTLPFTLLLLDIWPLRRIERFSPSMIWPAVREKLPFFALAAASSVITIVAQGSSGAIQSTATVPLIDRFENAVAAYAKYVLMMFYPADLGIWYPFDQNLSWTVVGVSALFLAAVTVGCVTQFRERRYLLVGWLWFVGTLVPVIGILQVGRQSMADRYTYVPYIGLSLALVWLFADIVERFAVNKRIVAGVAGAVLLVFAAAAFRQVSYWQNSETIYVHTLSITPSNYLVKNNYCNYLEKKNRYDEAVSQCTSAIADDSSLPDAYNTLGTVKLKQNKLGEAKASFEKAVEIKPDNVLALANLAVVLGEQGDLDAAGDNLRRAIEADTGGFFTASRRQETFFGLGAAAMKQKRYDKSVEFFQKVLDAVPGNVDAQRNLASSLHMQGRSAEGIKLLTETIKKNPNSAESYNTLGLIYAERGQKQEAIVQFQKALQINPSFAPAQANLRKAME